MKRKENKAFFALLSSFFISVLIFSVFFGQVLWSDVLTFQKYGDDLKMGFPGILKLAACLLKNGFSGTDLDTFNGATEFFSRANIPQHHLAVIIASFLVKIFPARGIYLLLYFLQMFFCTYFSIRLAQRFFEMKNQTAVIFACTWANVIFYETFYLSFYLIVTMLPAILYFEFLLFETNECKWKRYVLFSLPYVLCITSGYITISVAMTAEVFLIAAGYGILFRNMRIKDVLKKVLPPFIIGVGVCIPFCLELFIYQKKVVQSSSAMFDALLLNMNVLDLKRIITGAFVSEGPIEQLELITLGMFWIFILILFVCFDSIQKIKREERFLFRVGLGVNVLLILVALGTTLPFAAWFYTFVPVLGTMHLPLRYMMLTLILLYIGMAIALDHMPELKQKRFIKILAIVTLIAGLIASITAPYISASKVNMNKLMMEFLVMAIILYFTYRYGLLHNVTIILSCLFLLMPGLVHFYAINEVNVHSSVMKERSIVYDIAKQQRLDDFVSGLEKKDRYLYAAFDSVEDVPNFIPGNYGWYGYSKYHLSNYSGYEPHLSLPNDYRERFYWFDKMDWNYIANTRGDFICVDQESIDKNKDVLDQMVDWEESDQYLDGTHRLLKLKKFIPSYYTGKDFVEDTADTMDNGYFYCPDLKNTDLTKFRTDQATYYSAVINASKDSNVAFLPYPNRNYHYYVNGKEVEPVIEHMQAYIPIQKGNCSIEIKYENHLEKIKNMIFPVYYVVIALCGMCQLVGYIHKNHKKNKEIV